MNDEDYNLEVEKHIETLKKCEFIKEEKDVKKLCKKAKEILSQEDNVIYLKSPITVNVLITLVRYVVTSTANFMI
jgi:hypothetical protein